MIRAKRGDTVKVHYTSKLADGTVFDTTIDRNPMLFTIGMGQVIPGFEQAVVGMNLGESRTSKVPAEKAYGPYRKEMVVEVDRNLFPVHLEPEVGQQLELGEEDGEPIEVTVTDVSASSVTLDANHPLAGKDVVFDIQLIEIV